MSPNASVLAIGPGYSWQRYRADDGVECAAVYLERRSDGLRGLVKRDPRGWYVSDLRGHRVDLPESVIDSLRGTNPYGVPLLQQQSELRMPARDRRFVRGFPSTIDCPDCGARVVVA